MKNILSFLAKLKSKQISISLDDSFENLRIRGDLKNLTPSEKQEIKDNKPELIAFINDKLSRIQTIEPVKMQSSYPISDAQHRIWILSQFKDGSVAYNMPYSIYLNQDIDIEIFKRAINATIKRHEILRTVFKEDESGEIRQWILSPEELGFEIQNKDFRIEDISTSNLQQKKLISEHGKAKGCTWKQEKVDVYIAKDSYKPFDLENGPLLRAALLRVEENEYEFYFNMHHIICDGWSMKVLTNDVFTYYESYMEGKELVLPPLKIQYKDYATWQLSQLKEKSMGIHRKYWLNKFSGKLALLSLSVSNFRPDVKTHKGRSVVTYLNKDLTDKLKNFSLDREGTLFMSLVSTLKALLHRHTNQNDVIIGSPTAGRHLRELEDQIGFYVNTLALRTRISRQDSFEKVFEKVKCTILEANTHQMYPFDRLVEELKQNRQTSRSAVFDILVVLQNTGEKIKEAFISKETIDDIVEIRGGTCIYDIKFDFQEQGEYIKLLIEYNKDVYEHETIESFIRHFKEFSSLVLSDTMQEIGAIDYLSDSEKNELSGSDNQIIDPFKDKAIIDLFHDQVRRNATNMAIQYDNESYSYEELNHRANQVAHFLLEETRIAKEEKVGILLNAGLYTIASMLGVLKAGGAYVLMDTTALENHLLFVISDLGIRTLITEKEFIEPSNRLQWVSQILENYLCIDSDDVKSEIEHDENAMMSQDLWDHVGRRAKDQITSGGWISSYTGEAISDLEMEEYSINAYNKLKDGLHPGMKVLEIGCSSGITLCKIAPEVALYYGTDLSPVILSGTEKMVAKKGFKNVKLKQLVAHEISELEGTEFDLIIINSVIQNFHGHNYLRKVIRMGIDLLSEDGRIFIGDVMDMNKKSEMLADLEQFKLENQGKEYTTKTDFSSDFFVAKGYFQDLVTSEVDIKDVVISEKIRTVENELTKYRYDVILQIDKKRAAITTEEREAEQRKLKRQYDRRDLIARSEVNPEVNVIPDQLAFTSIFSNNEGGLKLLLISHSDIVRLFKVDNALFEYDNSNIWATFLDKDSPIFEIYGALLFGSKLILVPELIVKNTGLFLEFLEKERVTVLSIDTADVSYLLEEGVFNRGSQIRNLIVNGGALNSGNLQKWKELYPSLRIIDKVKITNSSFPTFKGLLTMEEKHELLFTFNDTEVDYPRDKTIIDLFEAQVRITPNKLAVVFEGEEFTYQELNEWSNQLAHYLRANYNIQPDDLVGIKQARSHWMIVSILGVLKSGGAYVPIDPEYPQERIDFIEEDTKCKVCIDETELSKFNESQEGYSKEQLISDIKENHMAYVIYTSGSTGEPKGVMLEHKNAYSFIKWSHDEFKSSDFDTVLFTTSLSFDLSVFEIFHSLTTGKELKVLKDGLAIPNNLDERKKIMINTVPSVVGSLLQQGMSFESVSVLNMAGESIPSNYKLELQDKVKEIRNLYGPSEDTTYTTFIRVDKDQRDLIGKPISNTQIYLLNEEEELQPIGVAGEICISGDGLSRGYLNQEALTKEKFIASPFKEGERLYKTGDLGRWLPDGNIEFIGRIDDQVKVRGYRIELGEIELALERNIEIEQAVVLAKENESKEKELVAYITAKREQNTTDLRSYLKEILPAYMLPIYYVQLEELPLNPNGKIDKKSLPDPKGLGLTSGVEYVAPRNEMEEKLVKIWEEVLGKENIGIKDDFFLLGGHSIKAVRLSNEYKKELSVDLSLEELFSHKNIMSQMALIESSIQSDFIQIEKVADDASYPISDAQRRLWVLSQLEESSVAYNLPSNLYLTGAYHIDSFKKAIDSTIERHEILRTVFKLEDTGEIRQLILKKEDLGFEIDYKDFREEQNKKDNVQSYMEEDSYKVFDLEKGPLLRAALLQVEDDEFVFYFNMHHIISDGWSMEVLSKDVFTYYDAYKENKETEIKELRIQYKDYSAWQLGQLEEESFKAHSAYWLDSLSGELPLLDLPSTKQRPRLKTHNGQVLSTYIDLETTDKLKKYSEVNGGSLFMGLLAAWNILMYRYTNQKTIIIGTPVAGREHSDLEDQIGFYVNTLALRNEINPKESFDTFYQRLKDNTLKSYRHQMYPFDRLVEEIKLQRDTGRSAVFDISITYHNLLEESVIEVLDDNVIKQIVSTGPSKVKFDIELHFQELRDCFSFNLIYNEDVYDHNMIAGLMGHYKELLNSLLSHPEIKIGHVNYLSEEEKHELLVTFNDTLVAYPKDKTIIDLFEEQVEKTPDNIAFVFEDKELTYQELNEVSNQLAHYLQKNYQIKPDDLVGIKLDRSEWMIISMLGVLKAGGAYVPIDPDYPQDRIDFIEKDIKCKVCIDEQEIGDFLESQSNYSKQEATAITTPNNFAYVIYTSGTTGNPKGVIVDHHNVVRLFKTDNPLFDFDSNDVWTMFHSYTFDFSVWEMYGALLFGGKLVLVPKIVAQDPNAYLALIEREEVTVLNQTPSAFYNLSKEEKKSNGQHSVRYVIFGGEALSPSKLQHWHDRYPSCQLINMYGITETTVHATYKEISQEDISLNRSNIGKAIPTVKCLVLDEDKKLVPLGIIGELYIGGEGVACGYLNRESLTTERFVANPFAEGERLYRTGDKVKQLIDGDFEYLGRLDDQVKIRGHRIELGDIENAFLKNKEIEEAVVLAKTNQNNEKELIAYITAKEVQNTSDLRSYLIEILPDYMLPTHYVQLEEMPLTSNGKIDKTSLLNTEGLELSSGEEYVPPRNHIEEKLIEIIAQLLEKPKNLISVYDNFFNLGINSISLMRLYVEINKEFNASLKAVSLFEYSSVEALAEYMIHESNESEEELESDNISGEMDEMIDLMDF